MSVLDGRVREAEMALDGGARRTPNERQLDRQHELIASLEKVLAVYRERKALGAKPAQQVASVLRLEKERLRMLRLRVQRERARPGG